MGDPDQYRYKRRCDPMKRERLRAYRRSQVESILGILVRRSLKGIVFTETITSAT